MPGKLEKSIKMRSPPVVLITHIAKKGRLLRIFTFTKISEKKVFLVLGDTIVIAAKT
jgi:hypothetical protein